jgi:hypothetical protein
VLMPHCSSETPKFYKFLPPKWSWETNLTYFILYSMLYLLIYVQSKQQLFWVSYNVSDDLSGFIAIDRKTGNMIKYINWWSCWNVGFLLEFT